jgi:flagellar hook protein FlgE
MSISSSMLLAGGAMETYSNTLAVAGDNIANSNTVGFRESRFILEDLLPTVNGSNETGQGVRLADVTKPFQQGALETTPNATDLAVSGSGFFIVRDPRTSALYYTRAGQFHLDGSGRLVNVSGLVLQGTAGDIAIGASPTLPAQATSRVALTLNLDAGQTTPSQAFPAGPDATSGAWIAAANFSSSMTVYDSLGAAHDLLFLYRRTGTNTWEYRVVAARSELDPSAPNSAELREVSAPGTLVFTSTGQLDAAASTLTDMNGLNWVNGASQTIAASGLSFAGTVQYGQPSFVFSAQQDGSPQGFLTSINIDGQGVITGRFSNGQSRALGGIVLANFTNVDDLEPLGDTLFQPTIESGPAKTGVPDQNGLGSIVSGTLEMSTVDLAEQFISLITSQRAFQANSQVVSTASEMYAVAVELKP